MADSLEIPVAKGPVRARVRPPGSKSITNRALVCAALADGRSELGDFLDSEDTRLMIKSLQGLGFEISAKFAKETPIYIEVHGANGKIPAFEADLFCGNSGTTIRFLTAMATLGHGAYRLDGIARMRERPIGDLLSALDQLGALTISEAGNGCPPVVVHANGLPGGPATIRGDISSQFLSGLLMAAPCAQSPIELKIEGTLVSKPYVRMTLAVMHSFGVEVESSKSMDTIRIAAPQRYTASNYDIEPDASAASYFWAAAAVIGGEVTVDGLSADSLQGDVGFVDCLEMMGCEVKRERNAITVIGWSLKGIDIDMNAISDTVQTLAVVALFAEGTTTIRNVGHIRHKETDRIAAVATELRKLGATVDERADGLSIHCANPPHAATIDTYNDHRMAMSFAVAGSRIAGVRINDPKCVEKTYPRFFEDFSEVLGER